MELLIPKVKLMSTRLFMSCLSIFAIRSERDEGRMTVPGALE